MPEPFSAPNPGGRLRVLWRTLFDWVDADVRVTVGDNSTGFAFVSMNGAISDLALDDDQLLVHFDNGSYIVMYEDMLGEISVGEGLVYISNAGGDVEIVEATVERRPPE